MKAHGRHRVSMCLQAYSTLVLELLISSPKGPTHLAPGSLRTVTRPLDTPSPYRQPTRQGASGAIIIGPSRIGQSALQGNGASDSSSCVSQPGKRRWLGQQIGEQ